MLIPVGTGRLWKDHDDLAQHTAVYRQAVSEALGLPQATGQSPTAQR